MNRILWTAPAVSDLDSIREYIARDSEVYADSVLSEIFDAVDQLLTYAESGRVVPELNEKQTRELIAGNYRVMYDIQADTIRILTVLHGARKFPR
ncbi:MAG: type II toxin-antitoxin system RelE/ParE family toxin [Kiritimatiellales bacterium]|jgi:addiction module RelE/StbE family toxin